MFHIKLFADFHITNAASHQDRSFLAALREIRDMTGARFVNFAEFDYHRENPDSVHYLTYPVEWIAHYMRQFYSCVDPLLRLDYRRVGHIDWRDAFLGTEQERLLESLAEHGVGNEALSIVLPAGEKCYGALSLVFRCEPYRWEAFKHERMAQFREAACRVTDSYVSLYRSNASEKKLTDIERKVLELAAKGLTDSRIAAKLGTRRWTVVGYVQSAKYKLGCPNRTAAVAKAISDGVIRLPEPA